MLWLLKKFHSTSFLFRARNRISVWWHRIPTWVNPKLCGQYLVTGWQVKDNGEHIFRSELRKKNPVATLCHSNIVDQAVRRRGGNWNLEISFPWLLFSLWAICLTECIFLQRLNAEDQHCSFLYILKLIFAVLPPSNYVKSITDFSVFQCSLLKARQDGSLLR